MSSTLQSATSRANSSNAASIDGTASPSWEIYSCWKEGDYGNGHGSPAPSIPRSQRQYDGDNWFEYCEVLVVR